MTGSAPEITRTPEPLPHQIGLPGGDWRLWRTVGLRGTGFPASQVLRLAATASTRAARDLTDARAAATTARAQTLEAFRDALDELRSAGRWDDNEARRPLLRAISRLNKGRLPGAEFADWPAVARLAEAEERALAAAEEFRKAFDDDLAVLSGVLRETAEDRRFQEAVIWQNRRAYEDGVRRLARDRDVSRRNARRREHESLVAGYLQRYCVKNDSIGFFGPMGWARITDDGDPLRVDAGADLVASREVYFEQWGLDALVASFGQEAALRAWIPPRRLPMAALEGDTLLLPGRTVPLPPAKAAVLGRVLALCDGSRTALDVVAALPVGSQEEGFALLESLRATGLIAWDLDLPLQPRPEAALRHRLERIGDPELRAGVLDRLDRLVQARDEVAAAAGDPDTLLRAFDGLERTFTELTGKSATRAHGETYGARTLVWEDCRRDCQVDLGPALLAELGPPMSLLLDSARWLTRRVADGYRAAFRRVYDELTAADPGREPRLPEFWARVQSSVLGPDQSLLDEAVAEFQAHWRDILGTPDGRRAAYRSQDLRPSVARHFAADGPGWPGARYQAPDVMIAAESPEAVACGDYQLVMGELHIGLNTLRNLLFVQQHPAPDELRQATNLDIPESRVQPVLPKQWLYATRTMITLTGEQDHRLLLGPEASWLTDHPGALNGAEIRMGLRDGVVVGRGPEGRVELDAVELLAEALSFKLASRFQLMGRDRHTPRVTIDRLVVSRESWRFRADELPFAHEADEGERFVAARAWAQSLGIPRFVFVKAAHEPKPFYVDLDSPHFVNAFAHTVRGALAPVNDAPVITVSEMLPTTEHTWLRDRQDRRYTSEFRIIAVDK
ncbi:lantibiotic dehydratase [Streptomyces sp. NPDC007070]|uniref:lantibiotic dehydratase n=1 Tax=Streptomyces sp. NPDC007070 TaxID=3154312 RepID=UPI0033EDD532